MKFAVSNGMTFRISSLLPTLTALLLPILANSATAAELQSIDSIRAAAERHALRVAGEQRLVDVRVEAHRVDRRLRLKRCQQPLHTSANSSRPSGRMTVAVRCPDGRGWALYVPVKVSAYILAVALQRSVPRGTILTGGDLELRRMGIAAVRGDYIARVEDAVGMAMRRSGRAGSTLYLNSVQAPAAVQRGQETDLLVAVGGVEVKMQGTALASGAPGELIRVRNVLSGKTLEGVVTPEGWVRIP